MVFVHLFLNLHQSGYRALHEVLETYSYLKLVCQNLFPSSSMPS